MTDIWMHKDSATVAIPKQVNGVIVEKHEITDECIEQIADAVVRKLMEMEVEHDGHY